MDDATRLVFADRFEDDCDLARATVIRNHVELSGLPVWSIRRLDLLQQTRSLCALNEARWRATLPKVPGVRFGSFTSGFVDTVHVSELGHGARVADHMETGTLRRLVVDEHNERTFQDELDVDWVRAFELVDTEVLDLEDLEKLLNSPFMQHVLSLSLPYAEIFSEGAECIAKAEHLHLTHLDLQDCYVGGAACARLAAASHLSEIEVLSVACNGSGYVDDPMIHDQGLAAVLEGFPKLKSLDIGGTRVTSAGLGDLFRRDLALESLTVGNLMVDEGTLTGSHGAVRLKVFEAFLNAAFTEPGAALCELAVLRLSGFRDGGPILGGVLASGLPSTLQILELRLRETPIERFAERRWPQLHTLSLGGTGAEQQLSGMCGASMPALRRLDIRTCGIATPKALLGAGWLDRLRVLRAAFLDPQPEQVVELIRRLPELSALDLAGLPLTAATLDALGQLPDLTDLSVKRCPALPETWPEWVGERLILLQIRQSGMDETQMQELVDRDWKKLRVLGLQGNEAAYRGLAADLAAKAPWLRELDANDPDAPPRRFPVRQLQISALDDDREPVSPDYLRGDLDTEEPW